MVGNELSCAGCSVRTVLQAWSECEKMERRKISAAVSAILVQVMRCIGKMYFNSERKRQLVSRKYYLFTYNCIHSWFLWDSSCHIL